MVNLLINLLNFLMEYIPLITSVFVLTGIFLLLSKSIKKHAAVYYIVLGIPLLMSVADFVFGLTGVTSFAFRKLPVIRDILRANSHMAGFGFPLLIIIMYIGALNPKNPNVKKLMGIRKEMSIISGIPVLAHSLVRITHTFPTALKYFTNHSDYMAGNEWVKSELGVGISNFGYVIGILMAALFLLLWITSFDSVHKRMGGRKWKKVQKWSYALYAMLFLHSMTLHLGWMLDRGFTAENGDYVLKQSIALASTLLIFGSYLILRVRKANKAKTR